MGRSTNAPLSTYTAALKAAVSFNLSDSSPVAVIFPASGNLCFQTFIPIPSLKVKRMSSLLYTVAYPTRLYQSSSQNAVSKPSIYSRQETNSNSLPLYQPIISFLVFLLNFLPRAILCFYILFKTLPYYIIAWKPALPSRALFAADIIMAYYMACWYPVFFHHFFDQLYSFFISFVWYLPTL